MKVERREEKKGARFSRRSAFLWSVIGTAFSLILAGGSTAECATAITSCGMTISTAGNYFLAGNLRARDQNCLTLTASNINIDLNGHTITGDGTHSGIAGNNLENIVINNGTISGFATGINLTISSGFLANDTLVNMKVFKSTGRGILIGGCCNNFSNVTSSSNGGIGIENDLCCSTLSGVITNNNGGDGMLLVDCCYVVDSSNANGNEGDGIDETGPGDSNCCTLVNNSQANHNALTGIELDGGMNTASYITTNLNSGSGIILRFCSSCSDHRGNNQVMNATANGNGLEGIEFASGFRNAVANVTANNNHGLFGVFMTCPATVSGVKARGNTTNLGELTSGGACTNLNNSAP